MRYLSLLLALLFSPSVATILAASGPVLPSPAHESTPAETPPPSEKKDKKDNGKKDSKEPGQFNFPVPQGMPVHGIKVPHRDENGKLVMVLEAEVANKLDDQHIEMTNMKIDAFDDDGKKIYIELPSSIFNLDTRILTGQTHALIRRDDFEITGDSLEFNIKNRQGTIRGHIKMTIITADNQQ